MRDLDPVQAGAVSNSVHQSYLNVQLLRTISYRQVQSFHI